MFIAHVSAALVAKPLEPKAPLGALLTASMGIDILCGLFTALGLEGYAPDGSSVFPWSHGLFMASVWSAAAFGVSLAVLKRFRVSLAIGLVTASHWALDFISHPMGFGKKLPPDLPLLFEGSPEVGLGLYNNMFLAIPVEFGLFILGILVYLGATKPRDRTGRWVFWLLPVFLFAAGPLAVLPPQFFGLFSVAALVFLPIIGTAIDRHRIIDRPLPYRSSTRSAG